MSKYHLEIHMFWLNCKFCLQPPRTLSRINERTNNHAEQQSRSLSIFFNTYLYPVPTGGAPLSNDIRGEQGEMCVIMTHQQRASCVNIKVSGFELYPGRRVRTTQLHCTVGSIQINHWLRTQLIWQLTHKAEYFCLSCAPKYFQRRKPLPPPPRTGSFLPSTINPISMKRWRD